MATIYDVAELAGVSIATVSNVINQNGNVAKLTEEKVQAAIKELNYVPDYVARVAKSNLIKNIGVIAEDISYPYSFSSLMIRGISEYCDAVGHNLQLSNLNLWKRLKAIPDFEMLESDQEVKRKKNHAIQSLLDNGVKGIVYVGDHPRKLNLSLPNLDVPITAVYSYTGNRCFTINANDVQGGRIATEYLIQMGHKSIGIIAGPTNSLPSHRRFIAYQETLMKYWLTFNPEYMYIGNWQFEDGYEGCKKLMALPHPPTAIFAMNDHMAYGVLSYAHKAGIRIPQELSVIGFDNLELSECYYPPLTTIELPLHQMGYKAAETLIQSINNSSKVNLKKPKEILIDCRLVERETVLQLNSDSPIS